MDTWNEQADKLEKALLDNTPALVLHFLRTASPDTIGGLAAEALPDCSGSKVRQSVVSVLAARLERELSERAPS